MVADGQIGLLAVLALCFLAGALAGVIALALRGTSRHGRSQPTPSGRPPFDQG